MNNIETLLIECLETVGNKISNCEYLRGLLKDGKKFEGWFQIVLACCLDKMLSKNDKEDVLVEHFVGDNRHADVFIKNEQEGSIAIEIKFIVKGKAITDARKSLLDQIHHNSKTLQSYGIALLVSKNDNSWFEKEVSRIEEYCEQENYAIKVEPTGNQNKMFCIKLLKHK